MNEMSLGHLVPAARRFAARMLPAFAVALAFHLPAPASADVVEYFHVDALGSVRVVTDITAAVVERRDYLPYGEQCDTTLCLDNTSPSLGQARQFTGKERDKATGLDYFGARYFRAHAARFTAVDPFLDPQVALLEPQRWNRYAYGVNNPLRFVDPDGKDAIWVTHADKTATLVIPVQIHGTDATEANIAAIIARANAIEILDANVSIEVVQTDVAISGRLNRLDFSPGYDYKACGSAGECTNKMGGTKARINSSNHDGVSAAAHDILHFAGIDEGYEPAGKDAQGHRLTVPKRGFTDRNIMTSRKGTQLTAAQMQEARRNRSTKKCEGTGSTCK